MASCYLDASRVAYDALAREYEQRSVDKAPFVASLVSDFAARLPSFARVLDVGCGVGLGTRALLDRGCRVTGIDISNAMLGYARARNPEAQFHVGNFLELELASNFDAVFACSIFHLFDARDAARLLDKIGACLLRHGRLFLSTNLTATTGEGVFTKSDYVAQVARFRRSWSPSDLAEFVATRGFEIESQRIVPDYYRVMDWLVLHLRRI